MLLQWEINILLLFPVNLISHKRSTESGNIWTWGFNGSGQLGTGDTKEKLFPYKVTGVVLPKTVIATLNECFVVAGID
jgi:hypothetical protein